MLATSPSVRAVTKPATRPTSTPRRPAPSRAASASLRPASLAAPFTPRPARRTVASRAAAVTPSSKLTVVVTGAGGRTGQLVVDQMLEEPDAYTVRAVARSGKSIKKFGERGAQTAVVDITSPDAAASLAPLLTGADALIIATSAVPKILKRSIVKLALAKLFRKQGVRPTFTWKGGDGGQPIFVDWQGQKTQIDAAIAAGVKRVILVSSMGVTQPTNMLNGIADGKILLYKRKAEEYLVSKRAAIEHCIIHPGGLIDAPGGEREVVLGVDDTLLAGTVRSIPRADVAALAIAAVDAPAAAAVSLDCVAKPPGEGAPTRDFDALLASLGGKTAAYTPLVEMEAL